MKINENEKLILGDSLVKIKECFYLNQKYSLGGERFGKYLKRYESAYDSVIDLKYSFKNDNLILDFVLYNSSGYLFKWSEARS